MTETKQQRWNKKHPEAMKIARERSSTKHFIKNYATEEDLEALNALIKQRQDALEDQWALDYDNRRNRLLHVNWVIRRHSGPEAISRWRWGDYSDFLDESDVQSNAEIYPYIYKGQYYAVALFDEFVCVGLPQYARFNPKAEEVFDPPMPRYYNKVFKRSDWQVVRALLQTKYDFHEVLRVRYLMSEFDEKVGNEYFYAISDWPMMTKDPREPSGYKLDLKTKTRMIRDDSTFGKLQPQKKKPTYLESTIDKYVWDKLLPNEKEKFERITEKTEYMLGALPLQERIGEDDLPRIHQDENESSQP